MKKETEQKYKNIILLALVYRCVDPDTLERRLFWERHSWRYSKDEIRNAFRWAKKNGFRLEASMVASETPIERFSDIIKTAQDQ